MNWWTRMMVAAALVGAVAATLATPGVADSPGQKLFLVNNCNACHSINSLHITKKSDISAPDLSKVGAKHNVQWFQGFLTHKESLSGKKHMRPTWKGSDADLNTLTNWLSNLK